MPESEFNEGVRALQFEFLTDAGAVIFHRARADAEWVGDFPARFKLGEKKQNAAFGLS